jgi:hypothetical protein
MIVEEPTSIPREIRPISCSPCLAHGIIKGQKMTRKRGEGILSKGVEQLKSPPDSLDS